MSLFHFPKANMATRHQRLGASDAIAVPKGGGPYTLNVGKQGGGYSALLYGSTNLTATPQDVSDWTPLTPDDTADIVDYAIPEGITVICVHISAITEPLPSKNPLRITVTTNDSQGMNQKGKANSGYHGFDVAAILGQYIPLVLSHMGDQEGSFWTFLDGNDSPYTDIGPSAHTGLNKVGAPTFTPDEPWDGAQALELVGDVDDRARSTTYDSGPGTGAFTVEMWMQIDVLNGPGIFAHGTDFPLGEAFWRMQATGPSPAELLWDGIGPALPDPGAWVASTAYAQGDRVRPTADDNTVMEAEVAGTSDTSQPTWPTADNTVVDGTVTWRRVGQNRDEFHSWDASTAASSDFVVDQWYHIAGVRGDDGSFIAYVDGVEIGRDDVAADDTSPGSFGSPKPHDDSVSYKSTTTHLDLGAQSGTDALNGRLSFFAVHHLGLTAEQIKSHFDLGNTLLNG